MSPEGGGDAGAYASSSYCLDPGDIEPFAIMSADARGSDFAAEESDHGAAFGGNSVRNGDDAYCMAVLQSLFGPTNACLDYISQIGNQGTNR